MIEIERKFLVHHDILPDLATIPSEMLKQAYLQKTPDCTIRVRHLGEKSFLTIKGKSHNISRLELEYEIPTIDADKLFPLCQSGVVSKTRYFLPQGNRTWEIDLFNGELSGLILAEIELESESEEIYLPNWISKEVSFEPRFFNSSLSKINQKELQELLAEFS